MDQVIIWRPWQAKVASEIGNGLEDRKILWVHDSCGKAGKTTLANYFHRKNNIFAMIGLDIRMVCLVFRTAMKDLSKQITIIIELRELMQRKDYAMLEHIHDGMISPPMKIWRRMGNFAPSGSLILKHQPRIIVLAKYRPDNNLLGPNKIKVLTIDDIEGPLRN